MLWHVCHFYYPKKKPNPNKYCTTPKAKNKTTTKKKNPQSLQLHLDPYKMRGSEVNAGEQRAPPYGPSKCTE